MQNTTPITHFTRYSIRKVKPARESVVSKQVRIIRNLSVLVLRASKAKKMLPKNPVKYPSHPISPAKEAGEL